MGDPHFPRQSLHVLFVKYITYQTIALFHIETAIFAGGYACCILTSVLQVLLHRVADGDDLFAAVAAPRVHHQWLPDVAYFEQCAPNPLLRRALEEMGYTTADRWDIGKVTAVERLHDGRFLGVRDPRENGLAAPAR